VTLMWRQQHSHQECKQTPGALLCCLQLGVPGVVGWRCGQQHSHQECKQAPGALLCCLQLGVPGVVGWRCGQQHSHQECKQGRGAATLLAVVFFRSEGVAGWHVGQQHSHQEPRHAQGRCLGTRVYTSYRLWFGARAALLAGTSSSSAGQQHSQ
jgi:hypothetical protein